jgi:hypothetical protein
VKNNRPLQLALEELQNVTAPAPQNIDTVSSVLVSGSAAGAPPAGAAQQGASRRQGANAPAPG